MEEYIPIENIEDIDTTQISIRDINRRYIDRNGFRYATRFNLNTRKIEVVRIVKGRQEAEMVRRRLQTESEMRQVHMTHDLDDEPPGVYASASVNQESEESIAIELPGDEPDVDIAPYDGDVADTGNFFEGQFMEECSKDFEKIKERITGINNFIRASKYFEHHPSPEYSELLREIDIECIQRSDKAVNYYKELISYPRPVGYYISRLSPDDKKIADALDDDEEKMELVKRWEIRAAFDDAFNVIVKTIGKLKNILSGISETQFKNMDSVRQQAIQDANMAVDYLLESTREKIARVEVWKHKYR